MANRNTAVRGLQIRDAFFGDGLKRNDGDGNIAELDIKTNDGLEFDTNQLTINYDNTSIGIISNALAVKADGISEDKLDITVHGGTAMDGMVLAWDNASGKLAYKNVDTDFVADADIIYENLSGNADTSLTLANTPVANSVQLYLNGLLQEEGSGKDYTISGVTITLAEASLADDIILVHYIKA
jgi:hypothetical protein